MTDRGEDDDWRSACGSVEDEEKDTCIDAPRAGYPEDDEDLDLEDVELLVKTLEEIDATLRQKTPTLQQQSFLPFDEPTVTTKALGSSTVLELITVLKDQKNLFEIPLALDASKENIFVGAHVSLNQCSRRLITEAENLEGLARRAITLGNCAYALKANAGALESATAFTLKRMTDFCFRLDPIGQVIEVVSSVLQQWSKGVAIQNLTQLQLEEGRGLNRTAEPTKIEINFGRYCNELVLGMRITQHFVALVQDGDSKIGEVHGCIRFETPIMTEEKDTDAVFAPRCSFQFMELRKPPKDLPKPLRERVESMDLNEPPRSELGRNRMDKERWTAATELYGWGPSHARTRVESAELIPLWGVLDLVRIASISCSSFHALALTDVGLIFSWGDGSDGSLGHGDLNECPYPRLVSALGDHQPKPILATRIGAGSDITGSHSACVSREGVVYTWGLGTASGRNTMKSSNIPAPIEASVFDSQSIVDVDCGGGFCVVVSENAKAYAFGTYSNGRLGIGDPVVRKSLRYRGNKSIAKHILSPRPVLGALKNVKVTKVTCGMEHCLALDSKGKLYSWGNGNAGQLGNGMLGILLAPRQIKRGFCVDDSALSILPPMKHISCGTTHSLALDCKGRLFSWGSGGSAALGHGENSTARARYSVVRAEDQEDAEIRSHAGDKQVVPLLRPQIEEEQPWRWPRLVESVSDVGFTVVFAGDGVSGAITNEGDLYEWGHGKDNGPSFVDLQSKFVEAGSCGGKNYFAVASGSHVGNALLREFRRLNEDVHKSGNAGLADVKLVVGSYELYAHKVILGCRSAELRRRIVLEERFPGELTTLNLSDLSIQLAEILLEYVYGGCVYRRLDPTSTLPEDLAGVARNYEMGSLLSLSNTARLNPTERDNELVQKDISIDLLDIVNDPSWADVVFTTSDNMSVYGHKAILCTRSPYFKKILSKPGRQHLKVPDRKASLLRILTYVYTGKTSKEGIEKESEFIQDLHGCTRYQLPRLQRWYEAKVYINVDNCLRLLNLTHYIQAPVLRRKLHLFIARNLPAVSKQKAFKVLSSDHPACLQAVVHTAKAINDQAREVNDYDWAAPVGEAEKPKEDGSSNTIFSLPVALLLIACLVYIYFLYDPAIMQYAPAINGFVSMLLILAAVYFISK